MSLFEPVVIPFLSLLDDLVGEVALAVVMDVLDLFHLVEECFLDFLQDVNVWFGSEGPELVSVVATGGVNLADFFSQVIHDEVNVNIDLLIFVLV